MAAAPARFSPEAFGNYYLVDPLAVGGMAEVFRAKSFGEAGFEKTLVVKRILQRFATDQAFIDMFIDEAKLSVQLTHPNIVQIFDFGKIGGDYFIAMEAVEGKDLKSLLRCQAKLGEHLPVPLACLIIHRAAKGLHHAHQRSDSVGLPLNIVHRDISPSNLLISYEGQVKVADFGIADADSASHETVAGALKGKYSYMSPEQSTGSPLDHRSDIFSLGICLWESVTGHRLFRRSDNAQTLHAVREGQIPAPSEYNPRVPPALDAIVLKMLERDVDARPQTAQEVQLALEDFLMPSTPDRLVPALAQLMHSRFGEDIRRERERLERGSKIAAQLYAGTVEEGVLDFTYQDMKVVPELGSTTKTVLGKGEKKDRKSGSQAGLALGAILALLLMILAGLMLRSEGDAPSSAPSEAPPSASTQTPEGPPAAVSLPPSPAPAGATEPSPSSNTSGGDKRVTRSKASIDTTKPPPSPGPVTKRAASTPPAAATTGPGFLNINSTPWAKVYVNGAYIGDTPIRGHKLPTGAHEVRLSNPRIAEDKTATIRIKSGETTKQSFSLAP